MQVGTGHTTRRADAPELHARVNERTDGGIDC
jgi:hypothetical protein